MGSPDAGHACSAPVDERHARSAGRRRNDLLTLPAINSAAWRRSWPALAFYALLAILMTYPLITKLGAAIPGDGFDGWQNYWNLWWTGKALVERGASPLFTNMLFHPTGVSLAFQTLNLFNGLCSLPVQMAGNLFLAYNAVVYFSFILGAFGAYLLARYVLCRAGWGGTWTTSSALFAGVVFGFSPFRSAHLLGHMQVFSLEWLPFAALALLRGLDHEYPSAGKEATGIGVTMRFAVWIALFLILVALCDWYFVLYLALFTALLLVYRLLGRALRWQHLAMIAVAWSVFLLLLSPMWIPMVREAAQASYMVPEREQAIRLSADLLAFVAPSEFHPLWRGGAGQFARRFTSTVSERTVFAGYLPLVLGVIAAIKLGRRSRLWWIATLTFALCALGPILHVGGQSSFGRRGFTIPLPYALLYDTVPFMKIARSIGRFDVMVMLSLSALSALGIGYLMSRLGRRRALLGVAGVAVVCFEFWSAPYPISPSDTPAYYQQLAGESGQFAVLNLPLNWDRPGYLLYQTVHGKPLTAGYISRDDPRTLVHRAPVLQEFRSLASDILCDDVGRLGSTVLAWLDVRYVILDRYKMPGGPERDVTTSLAEEIFAEEEPVYEDERLTIYQVTPPHEPLPFAVLGEGWGPRQGEAQAAWRSVGAEGDVEGGQATLLIHSTAGREIRLNLMAQGSEGSTLSVGVSDGPETSSRLGSELRPVELAWIPKRDSTLVRVILQGKGPCQVHRIDVR